MDFYQLVDELRRSYFVLDADNAEMQNLRDINSWRDMLTDQEYYQLIRFNKNLYAIHC